MEDRHVVATRVIETIPLMAVVFDGHGGQHTVNFAGNRFEDLFKHFSEKSKDVPTIIKKTCKVIHTTARFYNDGTCMTGVFLTNNSSFYVANIGDSRVVQVEKGKALQLTKDHCLTNKTEKKRVLKHCSFIRGRYYHNSQGEGLMPTRALGDHYMLDAGLLDEPEITKYHLTKDLQYIVISCDGLYEGRLKVDDVPDLLKGRNGNPAEFLCGEAIRRGSDDNVSVIVIEFTRRKKK